MKTNNFLKINKELLNEIASKEPRTIKALHNMFGFDFCARFDVYRIQGAFTINKVLKLIERDGHNAKESEIILLLTNTRFCKDELHLVQIDMRGGAKVDLKTPYFAKGPYLRINTYYAKCRFEEDRKKEDVTAYIIAQRLENVAGLPSNEIDYSQRFKLDNVRKCYNGRGNTYIENITLRRIDSQGEKVTYKNFYHVEHITNLLDKSGYIVNTKRENLINRARLLKAEREKARYKETDHSAVIDELKSEIKAKKAEIITALQNAETSDEIRTISKRLNYIRGLADVYNIFENLTKYDNEKEFKSNDHFQSYVDRIRESLATI